MTLPVFAQVAGPAPSSADADVLKKYDRNADGTLDATETAQMEADLQRAAGSPVATNSDGPVELSVFEVQESNYGYYAANAQSGTRLNSKVEDLASSLTVITLDQMDDFAMLDINDIFAAEAGTEGSGNYTDFSVNASGNPVDNTMAEPNSANRIRGVGSANVSLGNFETSGRVPVDRIGIEGVEISRGPSSTIFGLGNAAGTVNMVAATGNLRRNRTQVQVRGDTNGGFRQHLDVNRVIIKDKLAVRFSQVFMHTGFDLKPSGTDTERYNGMVKYQPFKGTTLTASYQYYKIDGNRPNSITPRDGITPWINRGSPTWDPLTARVYLNDQIVSTNMGQYGFVSAYQTTGRGSSLLYVDQGGVSFWAAPRGTTGTTPLVPAGQNGFNYVILNPQTLRATQPLFTTDGAISDKALYDWSEINVAAMNDSEDQTDTFLVQLSQVFLDTPRQLLAGQVGWFREDSDRFQSFLNGKPASSGPTGGFLAVDVNRRRLDGTPNPDYLRPYIAIGDATITDAPLLNDTLRAQLAYKLDLTREKGLLRWLGMHQFSGYYEYKDFERRTYNYKPAMVDNHAWLAAGAPRATSSNLYGSLPYNQASLTGTRNYYFYFVGDANGQNVDYAPTAFDPGVYDYTWGRAPSGSVAGAFVNEPTELGLAATLDGTGGAGNLLKLQKTIGAVMQNYLLGGRIVTTLGVRQDELFTKYGVVPQLLPDGLTHDVEWDQQWVRNWTSNEGKTSTAGIVVKPFRWLNLYANSSDSFLPADPAVNLRGEFLSNPSGEGVDFGFLLKLFDEKLTLRVNHYVNKQLNSRNGTSGNIARTALRIDVFDGTQARNFGLSGQAAQWIQAEATAAGTPLSTDQLNARVATLMQFSPERYATLSDISVPVSETDDLEAKGNEIELNYQPNRYWRMKLNLTEQEAIEANLSPGLLAYLAERQPVWNSIIDTRDGANWFTKQYNGANGFSASSFLLGNVTAPLGIALAKEGKSRPQIRKYRVNYSTNYQLAGLTSNKFLRGFNVGGRVRWEDKGAIGYYGVADAGGIYRSLDPDRPIYDKAHTYFDLSLGYKTKLFKKKVGANFQVNAQNVQESGRLQPVSAFPDGNPNAYRIVEPRTIIFSATFDL